MKKKFHAILPNFYIQYMNFGQTLQRVQFTTKSLKELSDGLKFYAFKFEEPFFLASQLDCNLKMVVLQEKENEKQNNIQRINQEDKGEIFFAQNSKIIENFIQKKDFDEFIKSESYNNYCTYINPKLIGHNNKINQHFETSYFLYGLGADVNRYEQIEICHRSENSYNIQKKVLQGQQARQMQIVFDFFNNKSILNFSRNNFKLEIIDKRFHYHYPQFTQILKEIQKNTSYHKNNENEIFDDQLDIEFQQEYHELIKKLQLDDIQNQELDEQLKFTFNFQILFQQLNFFNELTKKKPTKTFCFS